MTLNATSDPQVTRRKFQQFDDDAYSYQLEHSDGQIRDEYGFFQKIGNRRFLIVIGSYTYKDAEGKDNRIAYSVDKQCAAATKNDLHYQYCGGSFGEKIWSIDHLRATLTG